VSVVKRIVILGTGGNCLDILEALRSLNAAASSPRYECVGFLDDDPSRQSRSFLGVPVLGPLERASLLGDVVFVNGIGSARNHLQKPEIIARTGIPNARFETLVHPSAQVSASATLGPGTVVLQNATIASQARVGAHVIVLPNAVLSHDDVVGDYTCIAGGACVSGAVSIGRCCYLGGNCSILEQVRIGDRSLVGIGSVVLEDVPDGSVVVGNPARFLRPSGPSRVD
jgi:sugar O-acyltransferase (sialic acid O-acetyltransferase NeuD family)